MSDFSSGSQRDLFYTIEDSFGSGPSILNMAEIRNTEDSVSLVRDNFVSDERRGDRGIHDMRLGNKQPAGDMGFELSFDEYDRLLPMALCSDLAANTVITTNMTATYINKDTGVMTSTGETFVTKGFEVGDKVVTTGWSDGGNNGTFTINAVTEETMTLSPITGLVTVAVGDAEATVDLAAWSPWTAPYTDLTVVVTATITVNTIVRVGGSWIDDGVRVGDAITLVSATNNFTSYVTALEALTMTVNSGVATSAESTVFNTTAREIKKGTTVRSLVLEKAFTDIAEYQKYTGGIVNTMSLDINPNAIVTGSFGMLFKDAVNSTSAYHSGTPVATTANRPFDGFSGYINEANAANALASGMSISLDNGFERNFVLMANTCPQMTSGKSNVTGSITYYFPDQTLYNKFVNETESSLEIRLVDDDLEGFIVTLPRIKYTSADTPINSDGAVINTMNFQALDDSTEASNIIIRRQPTA